MTNSTLCARLFLTGITLRAIRITRRAGVIRCLTIAAEDAPLITIALEHIMPGWPERYLDEQIKQPTASPVGAEVRP
jgi:hypothetical protein